MVVVELGAGDDDFAIRLDGEGVAGVVVGAEFGDEAAILAKGGVEGSVG